MTPKQIALLDKIKANYHLVQVDGKFYSDGVHLNKRDVNAIIKAGQIHVFHTNGPLVHYRLDGSDQVLYRTGPRGKQNA